MKKHTNENCMFRSPEARNCIVKSKTSKVLLLTLAFCLALALPVFAQTATELEGLLDVQAVNYAQAARFVLRAADVADLSQSEAFRYAEDQKWLPGGASSGDQVRLDGLSILLMRAFDIKGGFLYSALKNPHYAYRELTYKGIIVGRADPHMPVTGEHFLFLLGRVLSLSEDA